MDAKRVLILQVSTPSSLYVTTMLRLGPTQIRLDAKDLAWHVGRHHDRQARRAEVPSGEVTNRAKRAPKRVEDGHVQAASYTLPHRPAFQRAEDVQERDTSIFSKEPVPGNARSFWDKILADAGTPTRTQSTALANATVIDPSEEFLEHTHSSRASIEDDITDVEHGDRDNGVKRRIGNPFQDSDGQSSSEAPTPTSSEPPEPLQNDPRDELDEGKVNRTGDWRQLMWTEAPRLCHICFLTGWSSMDLLMFTIRTMEGHLSLLMAIFKHLFKMTCTAVDMTGELSHQV